jgi:DNA mismatch repair protein MutS2
MKVAVEEITGIVAEAAQTTARRSPEPGEVTVTAVPGEGSRSGEINVIGMTVEEASERVDKFLDEAALAHRSQVRIITGHGTGALRRGLGEFLKTHPLVARATFESEERGGKAITVVELR